MAVQIKRAAVVLAAGKGKRMRTDLAKVNVPLAGKAMLLHVLEQIADADVERIIIVVGHKKDDVIDLVNSQFAEKARDKSISVEFVEQKEQNGTAHALDCSRDLLQNFHGDLLVACGDMPLIHSSTFQNMFQSRTAEKAGMVVLSARMENPTGYGRLVRDHEGMLEKITEEKDASEEIRQIKEVNSATYIFQSPEIFDILSEIDSNNAQQEYYLPDAIALYRKINQPIATVVLESPMQTMGANSLEELQALEDAYETLYGKKGVFS